MLQAQRNEESSTVDQFPDDDDDFALVADSVVANMENNQFHNTSKKLNNQDEVDEIELAYQREVSSMGLDFDNIDYLEQQNIADIRRLVDNKFVKPTEPIRKQSSNFNSDMDLLDADDNDDIFLNMLSNDFDLKNVASTSKCESNTSNRKLSKGDFSSSKSDSLKLDKPMYKKSGIQNNITNINTKQNLKNESDNNRNMKISKNSLSHGNSSVEEKYLFNQSESLGRANKSSKITTKYVPSVSNSSLRTFDIVRGRDKVSEDSVSASLQDEISPDLYNFYNHSLDTERVIDSSSRSLDACENDEGTDVQTTITSEHPFIYLCQIDKFVNNLEVYTVKAFVVTLTSLLSMKSNGWHLTAKISDGSAIVEILFSSTVSL